jgi:hypothetical protein
MKSNGRRKLKRACKMVKPRLQAGAGRWLLMFCERGHILRQFPYGEWSDARRRYGRKRAQVKCSRCAQEV